MLLMAKPRSGYKRSYSNQAPTGVWIEIKTEETYKKLTACAQANGCTIGQWAERSLRYALSGEPYIPPYRHKGLTTPAKRPRGFRLSDAVFALVEAKVGEEAAQRWIGATLLSLAAIELTRQQGERIETEWALKYRI